MQLTDIQQLQSLSDKAYSFVKFHVIALRQKKTTWAELTKITGLDSTRLQRIVHGKIGEMNSRFLIRACTGLVEYLESVANNQLSKKRRE
jgi:hypothetical protein